MIEVGRGRRWRSAFKMAGGAALLTMVGAMPAQADLADCANLYVLRLHINMSDPRPQVVLANSPNDPSGSRWIYPATGLTERAYQQLSAVLLSAKMMRTPVTIVTNAANGCDIVANAPYLTAVEIGKTP